MIDNTNSVSQQMPDRTGAKKWLMAHVILPLDNLSTWQSLPQ
jgi:hypothetical protein